jgi:hypothetical protein
MAQTTTRREVSNNTRYAICDLRAARILVTQRAPRYVAVRLM